MNKQAPQTVDEYLEALPEKQQEELHKLRRTIREVIPDVVEVISYGIPMFQEQEKRSKGIVAYSAAKKHCSLHLMSTKVMEEFREKLAGHTMTKGSVHFTAENPLPDEVVKAIVKARIAENEAMRKK